MFTAHEVEAFTTAVTEHLEESNDEVDLSDLMHDWLYDIVGLLVSRAAHADLPRFVLNRLLDNDDGDLPEEEAGVMVSMMVMLPQRWLVAARDARVGEEQLTAATQWVAENYGGLDYAGPTATVAAALWGGESGAALAAKLGKADLTFNDLHELLSQDLSPAMLWLTAGLVATAGQGNIDWLRRIDASSSAQ